MSDKIFISYRREDSHGVAGRLYDRLESHFGRDRIFMDVDAIQPGMDFVKAIEGAVSASNVFLVVIGPAWMTVTDAAGNLRIENPEDFVRVEVAAALTRNVRVIPVLVDRAMMPRSPDLPDDLKPLTRRNAIELSHTRFNMDAERLISSLEQIFEELEPSPTSVEQTRFEPITADKIETENLAKEMVAEERVVAKKTEAERLVVLKAEAGRISTVWVSILLTTIFWFIGGVIGGVIGGFIGGFIGGAIVGSSIVRMGASGATFGAFSGAFGGVIVGFVLGIALRHTERGNWRKQVKYASIGAAIGAALINAIGIAISSGDMDEWGYWVLGKTIVGVIGSGVFYWLHNRSQRND